MTAIILTNGIVLFEEVTSAIISTGNTSYIITSVPTSNIIIDKNTEYVVTQDLI